MKKIALGFAGLSAALSFGFFVLESIVFTTDTGLAAFDITAEQAAVMEIWAFNQGFYNLFLALGILAGIGFVAFGKAETGRPLITFGCGCMVGAAVVLVAGSGIGVLTGALLQGVPPLVAVLALRAADP